MGAADWASAQPYVAGGVAVYLIGKLLECTERLVLAVIHQKHSDLNRVRALIADAEHAWSDFEKYFGQDVETRVRTATSRLIHQISPTVDVMLREMLDNLRSGSDDAFRSRRTRLRSLMSDSVDCKARRLSWLPLRIRGGSESA